MDISGSGKINAEEAARFLKRSGLGDAILREVITFTVDTWILIKYN